MTDPRIPIYDSMVRRFYFFREPPSDQPLEKRLNTLVAFHSFLNAEYSRVLEKGLLAKAIAVFRKQLNPRSFTDEKCVDSLIWAFVTLGGPYRSAVVYR